MKEPKRIFDLLPYQLEKYDLPVYLADKKEGQWETFSTREAIDRINQLSYGLLEAGIQPDDKIAIISENRTEWNFVDFAIQQVGAISVPMYPTITEDDYAYIFEHASVKMAFVSSEEIFSKAQKAEKIIAKPIKILSFYKSEKAEHWKTLLKKGTTDQHEELEKRKEAIQQQDLATIIYTSGTTGRPKGVMLSHQNIVSNAIGASKMVNLNAGVEKALSFLPLCHIFERTAIYFYSYMGISIYYAENLETIGDNLRELKPHAFNAVPRLLEKIYDKIIEKGYALKGIKKQLFFWAVNLGLKYEPDQKMGAWYNFQLKIARKLIFSKWQEALGGEIKQIVVGASALQPRLKRIFWAAGIKIMEGYGLTETSPGVVFGSYLPERAKMDWIGTPVEKVEIKIAEDGEVLVKGPNVMMGYYKDSEKTAEAIKDDWFHTGDIGEFENGYLRITDRKKEMFKTSGGKYVAPQVIENKLKESLLIEQVMVVGESRKFPAALIVPNMEAVNSWCERHQVDKNDPALLKNPKLLEKLDKEITKANKHFGQWEQIKKFEIIPDQWSIDTGELTPTLKLKRRVIKEKYVDLIDSIYEP